MNPLINLLPLVFADPDQILFYRQQGDHIHPVSARQFMADAQALAVDLAVHQPIVNLCQDRYHFMVGFAATILAGKTNLLPSTYTSETLRQIFIDAPDALCLHDHDDWPFPYRAHRNTCDSSFPRKREPRKIKAPDSRLRGNDGFFELPYCHPLGHLSLGHLSGAHLDWANRCYQEPSPDGLSKSGQINPEHVVAQVFTSGSTGLPMPHNKTWGKLVLNIKSSMQQLMLASPMSLVGTVPPQHMFGFESLVLLCLIGRCPLWSGKPFYPADIVAALEAMPEPRMLVTTPFHLQALLDAEIALPKIDRLLLATAPLSYELAERAERVTGAPLFEIYGSTETGQIASRRPTQSGAWTLFPGIALTKAHPDEDDELFFASGGHIEEPVILSDRVQREAEGKFRLLGRVADQVNMAGKRSSLNYLTAQLKAIDGVTDGVFFLPKPKKDRAGKNQSITRLSALVIAPDLDAADILAALRERLDPVFLPRPLILVEHLPYNATGKLPQIALQAVLDQHLAAQKPEAQTSWPIPADHPVFAGHFPGHPLMPGALLLDWVVECVAAHWQVSAIGLRIEQAKFLQPVLPDARVTLDVQAEADRCRFTLNVHAGETNTVAVTGMLSRPANNGQLKAADA